MASFTTHSELIDSFVMALRASYPRYEVAVVLVGSVARSVSTGRSDLDLLVISRDPISLTRTADRLHVQFFSEDQFLKRLSDRDDFATWCVRYGIPIVQSEIWNRLLATPEAKNWPDWHQKIDHSARRLLLANDLFTLGDEEAAAEELLYAASHVGRALLLRENVFPLSRPEMISQVIEIGYPNLALLLDPINLGRRPGFTMRQGLQYLKKLLVYLDRIGFQDYLQRRSGAKAAKRKRRDLPNSALGYPTRPGRGKSLRQGNA